MLVSGGAAGVVGGAPVSGSAAVSGAARPTATLLEGSGTGVIADVVPVNEGAADGKIASGTGEAAFGVCSLSVRNDGKARITYQRSGWKSSKTTLTQRWGWGRSWSRCRL